MKQMQKTVVFLTGASGNMGQEGLKQLLERRDRFEVVALVLPTDRDREIMAPYEQERGLKIIWGDLTNYEDVLSGITGADIVLHVGGLVSPQADRVPEETTRVNLGGIRNIIRAIKAQANCDQIKLVYIGTVAQTGDRNPPVHWGRVGDPIQVSAYDNYAITKVIAEREVVESGLSRWVSLRQTGIAHWGLLDISRGPDAAIAFHQPINGVFEWVTVRDAGRLLANVCESEVPDEFWNDIYNIGGGTSCRVVNHEFMQKTASLMGIRDFRSIFEPNWFAVHNFHGQWYLDSDRLESLLHFRRESMDDYIAEMRARMPALQRLVLHLVPSAIIKSELRSKAQGLGGTLNWIRHGEEEKIRAYFGSKEEWECIPGWDRFQLVCPDKTPSYLDHGYDESKARALLNIDDMRRVAEFRGGECLSFSIVPGDFRTKLAWRCAFDHHFEASPTLILCGGHWCPTCLAPPWRDAEIAERSPFFAQVWYAHHARAGVNVRKVINEIEN